MFGCKHNFTAPNWCTKLGIPLSRFFGRLGKYVFSTISSNWGGLEGNRTVLPDSWLTKVWFVHRFVGHLVKKVYSSWDRPHSRAINNYWCRVAWRAHRHVVLNWWKQWRLDYRRRYRLQCWLIRPAYTDLRKFESVTSL